MVERHPLEVNVGDSNSPRTTNGRGDKKSSIYFLFRLKSYYCPYICENL